MHLNKDLKQYYLEDFQLVLKEPMEFWDLDSLILREALVKINLNPEVQTLYSKHNAKEESYLFLTFSKKVERSLFRYALPFILDQFNARGVFCFYEYLSPRENMNLKVPNNANQGAVNNPEYFQVDHIKIGLETNSEIEHERFWALLIEVLYRL
ncbi:MAG: hypothetical protein ACPGRE_09735 [Flavobacteriaceae bacterium]